MKQINKDLKKVANSDRAKISASFFKTGEGQYSEGDVFVGIMAPEMRKIAQKYSGLSLPKIQELLNSKINEYRWIALVILDKKYKKANKEEKENIFNFYLANTNGINNWNLVDISAPHIVGNYLLKKKDREILYELAKSENLWERRIAIVSTFAFIRVGELNDTLRVSKILLEDKHNLIHKAVGWMLREVGKKDRKVLEKFLKKNYLCLPRTTLRYAIERFPKGERKRWLRNEK